MKILQKFAAWSVTWSLAFGLVLGLGGAAEAALVISDTPLFLVSVTPDVMVMLDNSGSMKEAMYNPSWSIRTGFNPAVSYSGIFDPAKSYHYDPTIPVDGAAYAVPVDVTATGAFVEGACLPAVGDTTCWSGNYLNWATTRRIDASRQVLVGGKVESRAGFNYGGGLRYKIVGNNERSDRTFGAKYASSDAYSPVPNNYPVTITSPADSGAIQPVYDPYPKLTIGLGSQGGILFDQAGNAIGEFGKATIRAKVDAATGLLRANSWTTVKLLGSYAVPPVVVATPASFNGGDPGVVRIKSITATRFKTSFQEWVYKDGNHITEDVYYIALKAGSHTLPGGTTIVAGSRNVAAMYMPVGCPAATFTSVASNSVVFPAAFPVAPVVITSTTTYNDAAPVAVRHWNVTPAGFDVALQEEEAGNAHGGEEVSYIAVEPGRVSDPTPSHMWSLEAGFAAGITNAVSSVPFAIPYADPPALLASMQTMNGPDTAVLRQKALVAASVDLHVEEEKSCDGEVGHVGENVGYLALHGQSQGFNIALAVPNEPTGLLQSVANKVHLGISFYRYDPAKTDIYNGDVVQGGTLRFKVPINPFVKTPTAAALPPAEAGYRDVDGYVGSPISTIVDAVEHYPLVWGTTPIAENLWEVAQYFEQDNPYYADTAAGFHDFDLADAAHPERDPYYSQDYGSLLSCTRANVIIFTDGYPYKDADIPAAVLDYDGDGNVGDLASAAANDQGADNLDDVAYWGYCDTAQGACLDAVTGRATVPSRDLRADLAGDQYLQIDTVGFAGGIIRPVLQNTANNAGGMAYAAEDGKALEQALTAAFTQAIASASASATALNSGSITNDSKLFQATFSSSRWKGELTAFPINADGTLGNAAWHAASKLDAVVPPPPPRLIATYNTASGSGVPFQWNQLDVAQQTALNLDPATSVADGEGAARLDYLRGDRTNEGAGNQYRVRGSLLGDVVHSSPVYVGAPHGRYSDTLEAASYSAFRTAESGRAKVVYVGANDGMLHAFDADTGAERFAYVPGALVDHLNRLTDPAYGHRYFVDGTPTVEDAYYNGAWQTVLVGGLRAGGQAVYALEVTKPEAIGDEATVASRVRWEFSDRNDPDMGYSFGRPSIVRMHSGQWAAIFGNGYNNTEADGIAGSGHAVLYIVDIATGALLNAIDTGAGGAPGRPNGLSSPAVADVNGDGIADVAYAGDLFGNLWKFDLTSANSAAWDVALGAGVPLFRALAADGTAQPITVRPQVGVPGPGQASGVMVYFGTGKYFEVGDNSAVGQTTQTFYGIWDKNASVVRADLTQQTILHEVVVGGHDVRVTSRYLVDWTTKHGWYLDLVNTDGGNVDNFGERQVSDPILRNGRVIFTTLIPSADPCAFGGTGWLMEMDAFGGGRLEWSPFDLDGDGEFTDTDEVTTTDENGNNVPVTVSGKKSTVGIIDTPGVLSNGNTEYKYTSGSSGAIETTTENPGLGDQGRQSWRQLQ